MFREVSHQFIDSDHIVIIADTPCFKYSSDSYRDKLKNGLSLDYVFSLNEESLSETDSMNVLTNESTKNSTKYCSQSFSQFSSLCEELPNKFVKQKKKYYQTKKRSSPKKTKPSYRQNGYSDKLWNFAQLSLSHNFHPINSYINVELFIDIYMNCTLTRHSIICLNQDLFDEPIMELSHFKKNSIYLYIDSALFYYLTSSYVQNILSHHIWLFGSYTNTEYEVRQIGEKNIICATGVIVYDTKIHYWAAISHISMNDFEIWT